MLKDERISDETINAFVDGELDASERIHLLHASEDRDDVRMRLCEARNLKDLVRNAYADVSVLDREEVAIPRLKSGRRTGWMAAAAVALLVGGMFIGRYAPIFPMPSIAEADPVFLDMSELGTLDQAMLARGAPANIILHLETNDGDRIENALSKIEDYVARQNGRSQPTRIEIVANGYGLDLLRTDYTPFESRVRALAHDESLTILACQRALHQLKERGVDIDLIPEAAFASAALDQIIQRLREGWVYVKV